MIPLLLILIVLIMLFGAGTVLGALSGCFGQVLGAAVICGMVVLLINIWEWSPAAAIAAVVATFLLVWKGLPRLHRWEMNRRTIPHPRRSMKNYLTWRDLYVQARASCVHTEAAHDRATMSERASSREALALLQDEFARVTEYASQLRSLGIDPPDFPSVPPSDVARDASDVSRGAPPPAEHRTAPRRLL